MNNQAFKNNLYRLLKKDSRLWDDEKKELNETLLKDLIDKLDEKLIELLLSDKETKGKFFIKIKDVFVLKQNDLKFFIDENKLDNSYTQYQNKIGLRVGNKLLSERDEVVLNWPFKDCVLEGGMTKEDQKRNEIFFNEVLAKDEIDRLYDSKALVNWKRYTAKGKKKVKELKRDKDGTIRENLIIKGNNLLALHSLKEQFAGKVKLIYIDPPYNTSTSANTFAYNNTFNHSSWLAFMKNRIEIARELLTDDGLFVTAIDHYEMFYLGVLADEIFGRDNRLGVIAAVHNPGGRQDDKFFPTAHENILFYAKNINNANIYTLGLSEEKLKQFKLQDKYGKYKLRGFRRSGNNSNREDGQGLYYAIYFNPKKNDISLDRTNGFVEILPIDDRGVEKCWRWGRDTFLKKMDKYIEIKKVGDKFDIYVKERECDYTGEKAKTIWTNTKYTGQTGTNSLKILFGKKIFTYPKSPYMMKDILKITTKENDIILDYHAGSGTTAHAVLELNKEDGGNRKFILVEQMNYINTVTCPRVQKVMQKENIDDSFLYVELAKWNEEAKEKILKAKSLGELEKMFDELYERYFLNYNVETKKFKEKILKEEEFKRIGLNKQKKLFVEMLDMNQMYVNFSERADKKYKLSKEDIALSEKFYNSK
ncbi:site-specific DNA-methyltransferase [bacterium]|nr:site-specific DNA-methyltransferase [bacterium]